MTPVDLTREELIEALTWAGNRAEFLYNKARFSAFTRDPIDRAEGKAARIRAAIAKLENGK